MMYSVTGNVNKKLNIMKENLHVESYQINTLLNVISKLLITVFLFIAFSSSVNATVDIAISGSTNVDSVNTGVNFIYTLNYSVSSLTDNGQNVKIIITLPANLTVSGGTNGIAYDKSQVSSVTISGSKVTVTLINPISAGSTGQLQISLVYTNGSTPKGYLPPIFAQISATNANISPVNSDTSYVKALASNNIQLTKTANTVNATVGDAFTYTIAYSNSGSSNGNLNFYNAVITDTLPVGCVFITASAFGSIPYSYDAVNNIVSWSWGSSTFSGSGSATIIVKYVSPYYNDSSIVSNCATLTGNIPVLPLGSVSAAPTIKTCVSGLLVNPKMASATTGTGMSNIPGLCSGTVMAGTNATFTEGWKNSGNTTLDSVVIAFNVDNSVDMTGVVANYVKDAIFPSIPPVLTITKQYATNLHPALITIATYNNVDIYNGVSPVTDTPALATGEYITNVKIIIQSTVSRSIEPNMSEDLTYKGIIRTAAQGTKNGIGTLVEGTKNFTNCTTTLLGTSVQNCYTASVYLNSVALPLTNTCGTDHIVAPAPVFTGLSKSIINNTTSGNFSPGDTVHWQLRTYQVGIGTAKVVSWTDSLAAPLGYITGSALIKVGANGTFTALSNVTVAGQNITFNMDSVRQGDSVWINFDTRIADGTAPGSIANSAKMACSNAYINGGTPSVSSSAITVISAAAYTSRLGQNGCDTTTYVYYPITASATPQGKISYRAVLKNTGNVGGKSFTLVDVFPYIGDTRGSQYFANLSAPITFTDPNTTVYYDTVSNPCLSNFSPAINNTGCQTANWSVVPPVNITAVKAIKLTRSVTLNPLDSIVFSWPMILPVGVPSNITMYNSYTYQLSRSDNNSQLLPATPNKVGMITNCITNLGSIGNYVWIDSNANGLQDEAVSAGLNGIKVYLYKAGTSNTVGGSDAVLMDSTLTAVNFYGYPGYYSFINLQSGNYYVQFPVNPVGYRITQANQSNQTDGNSDGSNITGNSELVTIDANGTGQNKDNTTIDAGYIPCLNKITASLTNLGCNGYSNGAITLTPTGNKGSVNYLWNDGITTRDRSGIPADTFSVTATDSLGCVINGSYIITQPVRPVIQSIIGTDSLCLDSTLVFIDLTTNGFWTSSDTTIIQIDSLSGTAVASKIGLDTISYSINVGNCTYSQINPVVITDCGSGVNSGIDGGVESKSLGNVIAQRVYNKAINSISNTVDYSKLTKVPSFPSIMVMGTGGYLGLKDLLPDQSAVQSVLTGTIAVYNTSPTDLVTFTNAVEVQAQDYLKNNECKAVALATITNGVVYAHTKPICDRLRGAQLLDVSSITVNNVSLLQYKLLQDDGNTEYAVSFSAGRNANTSLYNIQSIWLNENFTGYDTMYNFQLWSSSSTVLKSMASNVLNNLSLNLPVTQLTTAIVPSSYIISHSRNGKQLVLNIQNNTGNTNFTIQLNVNNTELTTTPVIETFPVTIKPFDVTTVSLNMNDSYEADIRLIANNQDVDLAYSNDGTWNISYNNATTTINQFAISNDTLSQQTDEWRLFRDITVSAVSSDYISVYKLMRPAGMPKDITSFKGLKFTASSTGAGSIKITLVKNSITDWNSQYSIEVPIQNGTKEYTLSLSDFAALGLYNFDGSDVTTINFAFEVNSGQKSSVNLTLNNVRFTKYDGVYLNSLTSKAVSIYPNPSNGNFTCHLMSDKIANYTMRIINLATGNTVLTMPVVLAVGDNKIPVSIAEQSNEHGIYLVKLEGLNGGNYNPAKLVIIR